MHILKNSKKYKVYNDRMPTKPKRKIGRPTKYTPEMVDIANEYIERCSREATELPTIEGLALLLGVDDERIGEYAKKYPEFDATIKALKDKQKNQLINDGMYGGKEVNATMAIFLLKANHNMIETERKLLAGDNTQSPINIDITGILDKVYGSNKSTGD